MIGFTSTNTFKANVGGNILKFTFTGKKNKNHSGLNGNVRLMFPVYETKHAM